MLGEAATISILMSRQKLGQHFLHSSAWRERIARTLPADINATWLEIGPGHGEMTEFLAQRSRRVIAIETDSALASTLRQRAASEWPNVEIIEADILAVDLTALVSAPSSSLRKGTAFYPEDRRAAVPHNAAQIAPLGAEGSLDAQRTTSASAKRLVGRGLPARAGLSPDEKARPESGASAPEVRAEVQREAHASNCFRVYGNLPYYITSPILSHLFRFAAQIDSIHIVIQYEVAARIVATPGHREYAYLSALCQYFAHPEIVLRIPPGAFRPPPKVNSALVAMNLPGERAHLHIRDDNAFLKFLQNCFSQKRKTLRNNLKNLFTDSQIADALAACKLTPKSRAEEISLAQFAQLFRTLTSEN
jgi:16S rRNA (adenine1518-N6/adenine1519-N6)-dimethyltransferase